MSAHTRKEWSGLCTILVDVVFDTQIHDLLALYYVLYYLLPLEQRTSHSYAAAHRYHLRRTESLS